MRMILLSALFALGVGLTGATGASAAPISGLDSAINANSMIEQAQYYRHYRRDRYRYRHRVRCRNVRVCNWTPWGRRCHYERVCYRR